MKIPKYLHLPIVMVCITVVICVILMILPIDQVLVRYKTVNGVKTVECVSKAAGVIRYLGGTIFVAAVWSLIRKSLDRAVSQNSDFVSYRFIRFATNAVFFVLASIMPVIGILSIFEAYG